MLIQSILLSRMCEIHVSANETSPPQEIKDIRETESPPQETQEEGKAVQSEEIDEPASESTVIPQETTESTYVQVAGPYEVFSSIKRISDLPGPLESGDMLDIGNLLRLLGEDGSNVINSDDTITITLAFPAEKRDHHFRKLFWDTFMHDGQGGWNEMPEYHSGRNFALHPEDPRRIFSGVVRNRNTITVTVNFAGYFLLVSE